MLHGDSRLRPPAAGSGRAGPPRQLAATRFLTPQPRCCMLCPASTPRSDSGQHACRQVTLAQRRSGCRRCANGRRAAAGAPMPGQRACRAAGGAGHSASRTPLTPAACGQTRRRPGRCPRGAAGSQTQQTPSHSPPGPPAGRPLQVGGGEGGGISKRVSWVVHSACPPAGRPLVG